MKDATPEFKAALAENLTFLCRLWTITRKDGTVFRFTDHDRDVPFEGELYQADTSFQASATQTIINRTASNMDITILLAEGSLEYLDLERGLFDDASVYLAFVNYADLSMGAIGIFEGFVNTVQLPNTSVATLSLIGSVNLSVKPLIEYYTASCRANFGDARCKVDLALYSVAFTVDTVPTSQSFTASEVVGAKDLYALGVIEWTTGDNAGVHTDVTTNDAGTVTLMTRPPYAMQPGDTGVITRGCQKTIAACTAYNNKPNYRGEPYVPGDDALGL